MNSKRTFIQNLLAAFAAQGAYLLLGVLMALVVPKILGVTDFSYWQLFFFYIGYTGFFHFGVADGLYLRLGGSHYEELDREKLGAEFQLFILFQVFIALILLAGILLLVTSDSNRRFVLWMAAIYLVLNNASVYLGYLFQAVNQTKWFSYSVILDNLLLSFMVLTLVFVKGVSYVPFVISHLISKTACLLYCVVRGREIVFSHGRTYRAALSDMWTNCTVGINLMISNIASMLILGIGRMIIDNIWGIDTFGKISLAFSLTSFFLMFIQQVSMVLFPALRQAGEQQQTEIYTRINTVLAVVSPIVLVLYIPVKAVLALWLPSYLDSLTYLAFLLPLCIFDGKMQMLSNTYFKVLRKEKTLLLVNIISLAFSAASCAITGYLFKSMTGIVAAMVLSVILRSILSDVLLSRTLQIRLRLDFIGQLVLTVFYILAIQLLPAILCSLVVAFGYLIYLFFNRSQLISSLQYLKPHKQP